MTVDQLSRHIATMLATRAGEREAAAMTRIMFEHMLGYSPVDIVLHRDRELEDLTVERFEKAARRVASGEPLQYVLGVARFMGCDFAVDPSTLIPRPETAGLVDMIVDDHAAATDLRVLDIGTGSGCIAIMLARMLRFPIVTAVDISAAAIDIARQNSRRLGTERTLTITQADALKPETMPGGPFDIIVSNPPYIAQSEAADMEAYVLDHEPHTALFVPDRDPLLFYTAIARYSLSALAPGTGRLYFEINPLFAADLTKEMRALGYADIDTRRDYLGRLRYLTCRKP